jgi:hypothetical protein
MRRDQHHAAQVVEPLERLPDFDLTRQAALRLRWKKAQENQQKMQNGTREKPSISR